MMGARESSPLSSGPRPGAKGGNQSVFEREQRLDTLTKAENCSMLFFFVSVFVGHKDFELGDMLHDNLCRLFCTGVCPVFPYARAVAILRNKYGKTRLCLTKFATR
jgi:hypothetical protein